MVLSSYVSEFPMIMLGGVEEEKEPFDHTYMVRYADRAPVLAWSTR